MQYLEANQFLIEYIMVRKEGKVGGKKKEYLSTLIPMTRFCHEAELVHSAYCIHSLFSNAAVLLDSSGTVFSHCSSLLLKV